MLLSGLDRYRDYGILLIRVGLGIMFMYHGYPKITGGIETWVKIGAAMKFVGVDFMPAFWGFMAAVAEFGGGALLALGFMTRVATLMMAFTMFVAVMLKLGTGAGLFGASQALEMLITMLGLTLIGPGAYSLDHQRRKRR